MTRLTFVNDHLSAIALRTVLEVRPRHRRYHLVSVIINTEYYYSEQQQQQQQLLLLLLLQATSLLLKAVLQVRPRH